MQKKNFSHRQNNTDRIVDWHLRIQQHKFLFDCSNIDNWFVRPLLSREPTPKIFFLFSLSKSIYDFWFLWLRAQNNTSAHLFSSNSQLNFKIVCVSEKHYTYLQCIGYTHISPALFDIWKSIFTACSLLRAKRTTKFKLSSEAPKSTTTQITIENYRIGKLREFEQRKTIPFSDHWSIV